MTREILDVIGRTCLHCLRRVERLLSEDTCPKTYCCPMCRARWIFCGAELCAGCHKSVSVFGTFGGFSESESEAVLIEGAAYCWECAEAGVRTVERTAEGK